MRVVLLSLFLVMGALCSLVQAQSASLDEKQKAVLVFDVRLSKMHQGELGKTLALDEKLSDWHAQNGDDGPDPSKLERVFGAMSAPEDMASAMTLQMGEMPMEFFVQLKFVDEKTTSDMLAKFEEESGGKVEKNGKTYFKPPAEGGAPEGMLAHQVDAKTIEFGTEAYIFHENRKPFTDNLTAAWGKAPKNDAVRIVMDLEGAKGLIAEAVAMGKQQTPDPMMGAYMDLVDNMKNLRISLDLESKNLLTIQATGVNESDASELKDGLDSLMGMAKMGIQSQLPTLKEQDADGAVIAEELAKSLMPSNDGAEVSIVIPKPEGFDAWVKKAAEQYGAMLGGGAPAN